MPSASDCARDLEREERRGDERDTTSTTSTSTNDMSRATACRHRKRQPARGASAVDIAHATSSRRRAWTSGRWTRGAHREPPRAGVHRLAPVAALMASPHACRCAAALPPEGAALQSRALKPRPAALDAHAGLPRMPRGRNASTSDEDEEREHDAVRRRVREPVRLGEAQDRRADGGADDAAHAADDDDDQRREQQPRVFAGHHRELDRADHAAEAGEARADRERGREHEVHVDAGRGQHAAVVHAGADHHARRACD